MAPKIAGTTAIKVAWTAVDRSASRGAGFKGCLLGRGRGRAAREPPSFTLVRDTSYFFGFFCLQGCVSLAVASGASVNEKVSLYLIVLFLQRAWTYLAGRPRC